MMSKMKGYCCSLTCTGMNDHSIRPKDYRLIENIPIYKTFCPNCGYALIWTTDAINQRKKTTSEPQTIKYKLGKLP